MDRRLRQLEQQVLQEPGPEARVELRRALRRLADFEERGRWNAAEASAQDRVLDTLGRLLGGGWEPGGAARYAAGGSTHRLGRFAHRGTGLELVLIPGGRFVMGSDGGPERERPRHEVRVPALLLGRHPVRQREWDRLGGDDAREWTGPELPMEGVSWHDVQAWLRRAGDGLRLPSEAEWEYACRAGTTSAYFWGERMDEGYCWYGEEAGEWCSHPPAAHDERPNAFGLVDMSGNVAEWCQDGFVPHYEGAPTDGSPREPWWFRLPGLRRLLPEARVLRGGDSFSRPSVCRSAARSMSAASDRGAGIGFRVARTLPL